MPEEAFDRAPSNTDGAKDTNPQLGALDLGSNSFHLLVATESHGRIQIIDKYKEMVRLADGLDANNSLSTEVIERAMSCLERLGQRLRPLAINNVRVVGTNTLRKANNSALFIKQAEAALGHKIEIVSGREEARLIFLGVSHDLGIEDSRRLVVDIGGGSTEVILGRHNQPEVLESLHMGCVSMSKKHFGEGKITKKSMNAAVEEAMVELEPVAGLFTTPGWETAIGTSGTINAIAEIVLQTSGGEHITPQSLEACIEQLFNAQTVDNIDLPGLADERKPVIAGGVAILQGIFQGLGITQMATAQSAMREGIIYDLLGRQQQSDARDQTVNSLIERYRVDRAQSRRVRETALTLLSQVAMHWALTEAHYKHILGWAADLHELGMDISHSGFHKHGAYLLENMDLPGFSRPDQSQVATLVRAHRRKLGPNLFPQDDDVLIRLAILLRLAIVLHRNRSPHNLPHIQLDVDPTDATIKLGLPEQWLDEHPLTRVDLLNEANYLAAADFQLFVETF
ncbi:MAG: Ppx/GppA phosphatase family protein [Pseudomonadota bacterium]